MEIYIHQLPSCDLGCHLEGHLYPTTLTILHMFPLFPVVYVSYMREQYWVMYFGTGLSSCGLLSCQSPTWLMAGCTGEHLPSPGALCKGLDCWQRDVAQDNRYHHLNTLPLCQPVDSYHRKGYQWDTPILLLGTIEGRKKYRRQKYEQWEKYTF